jgi:AAA+ superfamily predicted ATPase
LPDSDGIHDAQGKTAALQLVKKVAQKVCRKSLGAAVKKVAQKVCRNSLGAAVKKVAQKVCRKSLGAAVKKMVRKVLILLHNRYADA